METKLTEETRVESDLIGAREIPASALKGTVAIIPWGTTAPGCVTE